MNQTKILETVSKESNLYSAIEKIGTLQQIQKKRNHLFTG